MDRGTRSNHDIGLILVDDCVSGCVILRLGDTDANRRALLIQFLCPGFN